jgi:hypothetical protein
MQGGASAGFPPPPGPGAGSSSLLPADSAIVPARGKFAGLIEISARRAFRLRIEPDEVLPSERAALELASPPITDRNLQAFLAWRRSILLVVATILAPLSILRLIDAFRGPDLPTMMKATEVIPALAEAAFCGICIWQLAYWTQWRQQRKWILIGWAVFMLAPFVLYLYPMTRSFGAAIDDPTSGLVMGTFISVSALLSLGPKAISLMPGLVRAAMVSKLLFPGSSSPGWLIAVAAPFYALFAFLVLMVPYQVTGSGWFLLVILALIGAQFVLARAGFQLARPTNQPAALAQVNKVRSTYLIAIGLAALFLIIGLFRMVKVFQVGYLPVFTTLLAFAANILILTLIGSDLVITYLDRARAMSQGTARDVEDTNLKLAAFVGGSEPPVPPPFT